MHSKKRENLTLMLFVTPALIVYIIFKLYPAIAGMFYALTDWNGLNRSYHFVGISNFKEIMADTDYWNSLLFTTKYVVVMLVVANVTALMFAVAIESRAKGRGIFRTLFYMPNMISMIIGGYMWSFIFTKVLYYLADNWGITFLDKSWIGDPKYAFIAIIIVSVWGSAGYLMIIYMAALQGVPEYLKESASLDGANAWHRFWKIIFPMIQPALTICIFWTLNSAFQVFDVIYSLTGGGPGRVTQSVAINIYEEAFSGNIRYGYATAKSSVLFLIILLITIIQLRIMKGKEQEL
ncbi:carbohydrate ABC transporter permease [Anaerocolumna xylanovorans]|uniref:Raffinose/stachyose/melibiose transport system permease protein n=1 Tax=Anaerocolumna xylanovorans DSM 12503 TaxID=1121345 RepID=A0A1M7YFT4_9FIRM|nr:sugar ABC transporter permease [Anaerocolumna xylanovorans]SHO51504.1 raffinose/stachyose/melibiose transport system permease protein [Anaerocolumna xylanovorans DSM 12503]